MKQSRRIKIIRTKLGREKVWGMADDYPLAIDIRLKGKKELEIIVHECFHFLCSELAEKDIMKKSILLTNTLWHEGFRKVDNSNDEPLQDGTL